MNREAVPLYQAMYQGLKTLGPVSFRLTQIVRENYPDSWGSEVHYCFSTSGVEITVGSFIGCIGRNREEAEAENQARFEAFKKAVEEGDDDENAFR